MGCKNKKVKIFLQPIKSKHIEARVAKLQKYL